MNFKEKAKIMDADMLDRAIKRISHEILEHNKGTSDLAIIGIRNKGVYIAQRIAETIFEIEKTNIPVGILDITLYRDDLTTIGPGPIVHKTEIGFGINDKKVILVDDVLFTGRTIRCALDALIDFGRPKNIQLAVLIDRGHRELPIKADYVGKNVPTSHNETIEVRMKEVDSCDEIVVVERA